MFGGSVRTILSMNGRHKFILEVTEAVTRNATLYPRSRIEIQLAYEISGFLNLDLNDTMIEAPGITRDLVVDMKVPQHSHRV